MKDFLKRYCIIFTPFFAFVVFTEEAKATRKVSSPYVAVGKWELENHGSYAFDEDAPKDKSFKSRLRVNYGFNKLFRLGLNASFADTHGQSMDFTNFQPTIKSQLTEKGEYFFDVATKLKYSIVTERAKADKLGATLYLGKKYGNYTHYLNVNVDRETGNFKSKGTELSAYYGVYMPFNEDAKIGLEYYGDLDELSAGNNWEEQTHQIGPVFIFKVPDGKVILGVLQGITNDSPDQAFKWELKFKL